MTKQMEGTYLQIEKDFEFFGITDNMTWKEIKARMREIKKQFDERWNNRTYNDIRITFTRLWQYAPLRLLKGNEIKVFISLACFAKQPGRVLISMSMMQEMMDLSEGTIRNAVKSLQAQGFLIKEKSSNPKDNNKPTAYTLNPEIMAACKINLQEYRIKQFKNQMDTKTECIYMQLCETAKKYIAEPIKDAEGVIVCHEVKRASEIPKRRQQKGDTAENGTATPGTTTAPESKPIIHHTTNKKQEPAPFEIDENIPFNGFTAEEDKQFQGTLQEQLQGQMNFSDIPGVVPEN